MAIPDRDIRVVTVLRDSDEVTVPAATGLWLRAADIELATGWVVKPEGFCQGRSCIPATSTITDGGWIDAAALWRMLGRPVLSDRLGNIWVLGSGASTPRSAIEAFDAPDFALPDLGGTLHRLSALRGSKVLLVTWASWCGCRMDLAAWQELYERLRDRDFMIVAVAEDSRGAETVRPWIEQARAAYWCLLDQDHVVAALYGLVNVPQAVWIDEAQRIVRPPETAGWTDHFRRMDRVTRAMEPADRVARLDAQRGYLNAVEAWVRRGDCALGPEQARAKLPVWTPAIALAHAHFRLGAFLHRHGNAEEAGFHLAEATRLHPQSWTIWRQAAELQERGKARGPEFWARVDALGERPYYPAPDLPGF